MPAAPHPRMHGITHVAGGPDPVPGLLPPTGDTLDKKILAVAPAGFWKLNESSGHVAADSSGNGQDLSTTTGELDPLWGQPAGPPGQQAASFEPGVALDSTNSRVHRTWPPITASFTAGIWINRTTDNSSYVMGQGIGTAAGWQLRVTGATEGPPDEQNKPIGIVAHTSGSAGEVLFAVNTLLPGGWVFVALTYDHAIGQSKLYINGLLDAASPTFTFVPAGSGTGQHDLFIGHLSAVDLVHSDVIASYAFLVNRTLTGAEILNINAASVTTPTAGAVLTTDADGNPVWVAPSSDGQTLTVSGGVPVWKPPAVEVQHGGGKPVETTVTTPAGPYAGDPTDSHGWHYTAHTETVVLYDSSPARFDVPSRQWVRVPFNTVRIQRQWELTVDGDTKSVWLTDDRDLTSHAKDGLLHVTSAMLFGSLPQTLQAWFSNEYPVLDYLGLPDDDIPTPTGPIVAPDAYVRAARYLNASTGSVLRTAAGSSLRRFFEWRFYDNWAGVTVAMDWPSDNPYPIYPVWAPRPLTLPQPYPQLGAADSLAYQGDSSIVIGIDDADLHAGDNICLQTWQDTPWQLRFSTDRFPPVTLSPDTPAWEAKPNLALTFNYDPASINHTTGALL